MPSSRISLVEIFGPINGSLQAPSPASSSTYCAPMRAKEVNFYSPPPWYNSDTDDIYLAFSAIEETSVLLSAALKPSSFAPLRHKVSISFEKQFTDVIYGSNSLEGAGPGEEKTWTLVKGFVEGHYSTLSQTRNDETGKYLEQQSSEVIQYVKAFLFLKNSVAETKELNNDVLLKTHEILTKGVISDDYYRGVFRNEDTDKLKENFVPSEIPLHNRPLASGLLPSLMDKWLKEYSDALQPSYASRRDVFVTAANLQYKFLIAHPFYDGNGRMARMLSNVLVSQHLLYALIPYGANKITKRNYKSSVKSAIKKGSGGVMAYDALRAAAGAAADILDIIGDMMEKEEVEEEVWKKEVGDFMSEAKRIRAKFDEFFHPDAGSELD